MTVYASAVPRVDFAGPTLFSPIIKDAMKQAQTFKDYGSNEYNILLVLTGRNIVYLFTKTLP